MKRIRYLIFCVYLVVLSLYVVLVYNSVILTWVTAFVVPITIIPALCLTFGREGPDEERREAQRREEEIARLRQVAEERRLETERFRQTHQEGGGESGKL